MNILQLKELIKDLPDNMPVGGNDWVGSFCECEIHVRQDDWKVQGCDSRLKYLHVAIDGFAIHPEKKLALIKQQQA